MTVEEFCRLNNLPATTARRVIQRAERPADVGVREGGTERRPTYAVTDPGRLREAITRHAGSGAITPASIVRLHAVARHALDSQALPPGVAHDALQRDVDVLRVLLPPSRAA